MEVFSPPLKALNLKKNISLITHFGGCAWKWGFTDKYQFQNNEFYLIGFKQFSGHQDIEWKTSDFNLSTGKIIIKKVYYKDYRIVKKENETFYKKGIKVTLQNRNARKTYTSRVKISVISPKYKFKIGF